MRIRLSLTGCIVVIIICFTAWSVAVQWYCNKEKMPTGRVLHLLAVPLFHIQMTNILAKLGSFYLIFPFLRHCFIPFWSSLKPLNFSSSIERIKWSLAVSITKLSFFPHHKYFRSFLQGCKVHFRTLFFAFARI